MKNKKIAWKILLWVIFFIGSALYDLNVFSAKAVNYDTDCPDGGFCNCLCINHVATGANNNTKIGNAWNASNENECEQGCADLGANAYNHATLFSPSVNFFDRVELQPSGLLCCANSASCINVSPAGCNTAAGWLKISCSTRPGCPQTAIVESTTNQTNSTTATTSGNSTSFTNPLAFETVEGFLGGIMSAIQKIIVVLALVVITIGSVMILASAGNSGMVEKGKEAITMALVGLVIGFAAPSLLKELANIVGWGGATPAALTLSEIAVRVLSFLLGTMGILALIMLVIGAIMYLTSAGDEDRIDKGKEIFKYSLIGVLMAMASMVLVKQIALFFV